MSAMIPGNTQAHAADGNLSRYDPTVLPDSASFNDALPPPAAPALTPRERLKQAFSSVETARDAFQAAQGLAVRAATMHDDAKDRFRKLQSAEHDIRQWKVDAFKSGSSAPMPPDLLEARRESIHAAEELQHADAMAGQMSNELAAAERAFQDAENFKLEAANARLIEEAKIVVEEIKTLGKQRKYWRNILRGITLSGVSIEEYRRFETLKQDALYDPSIPSLAYPPVAPEASKFWSDFRTSLLSDPDATHGELPAADTLWS